MIIYFVAGEASADHHGAALMEALRKHDVDLRFYGRGGPRMSAMAGAHFKNWIDEAAVMGLWEVLKRYGYFRKQFWETLVEIEQARPDAVVLIDYPGFNLRLASVLRRKSFTRKLIYYISPQVWAWNRGRIPKMARMLDLMICIFPFEKPLYEKSGLKTVFVGYPHLEELAAQKIDPLRAQRAAGSQNQLDRPAPSSIAAQADQVNQSKGLPAEGGFGDIQRDEKLVGIFPGSRRREVHKMFPIMFEAARIMRRSRPDLRFEAAAATAPLAEEMRQSVKNADVECKVTTGRALELMQRASAGMVASGTATIEAAYFRLPFVIVYRFAWLTGLLVKNLVKVPWAGMVNILANREVVREFLHEKAQPEPIANEMMRLTNDPQARQKVIVDLDKVIAQLGGPGASERAAAAVFEEIGAGR
jgi:lipid-A-disaccharide synthase